MRLSVPLQKKSLVHKIDFFFVLINIYNIFENIFTYINIQYIFVQLWGENLIGDLLFYSFDTEIEVSSIRNTLHVRNAELETKWETSGTESGQ